MIDLFSLIKKHGQPRAILDYQNQPKKIIFNFDEIIYMNQNYEIFINNKQQSGNALEIWQDCIQTWKKNSKKNEISAIGFFSYDFKDILYPNYNFKKNSNKTTPLFWFAKPSEVLKLDNYIYPNKNEKLSLKNGLGEIEKFEKVITKIKKYLYNGDVYQINYTQPLELSTNKNSLDLYMQIKNKANPEYGFYLDINKTQFLSFSPEKFFTKTDKIISSYPIKGTIKRIEDFKKDKKQIESLSKSEKDKAEHLMIVDLLRNDLGKISKFGTVKVTNLFKIKTFETIHHMESKIQGTLDSNIRECDIIDALFPGGSITGAPKYKSIQLIDKLEKYNRGLYTGCIGTVLKNGDMDFNICIRTMTVHNNIATYPVGGGVVWDSTAKNEYNEANEKANILNY